MSHASDWDDFEDQARVILESFQPSLKSNGAKRWKSDSCTLEDGITVSNVMGIIAAPGAPIEVIGTIANSCSHPIDVQIIAQAFGTHGNILAAKKEFMYEIYGEYMVPHPIPVLHVVPGQPVVVRFYLYSHAVGNDEAKAVDIAVADVDSAP